MLVCLGRAHDACGQTDKAVAACPALATRGSQQEAPRLQSRCWILSVSVRLQFAAILGVPPARVTHPISMDGTADEHGGFLPAAGRS